MLDRRLAYLHMYLARFRQRRRPLVAPEQRHGLANRLVQCLSGHVNRVNDTLDVLDSDTTLAQVRQEKRIASFAIYSPR